MAEQQLTVQRQYERRQLITIFAALEPGDDVLFEEITAQTGLDATLDAGLIYGVCEHCRDVLDPPVVIKRRKGLFHRATDEEIAGHVTDRRRQRIYNQAARGAGEAAAVVDFAALDHGSQHQLLAKQAIFGAVAMTSHRKNAEQLAEMVKSRALSYVDPEDVIAAARKVR